MHLNDLRRVLDGQARVMTGLTFALLFQDGFVADKNNLDVTLLHSLERTLHTRCRAMIPPHGVERDLRAACCTHGWCWKDRLTTCRPLGSDLTH